MGPCDIIGIMREKANSKNKGTIVAIVIVVIMIFAVSLYLYGTNRSISRLTEEGTETGRDCRYHFAMVVDNYDNPYWNLVNQGAQEAALENEAVIEVTSENLSETYQLEDRLRMAVAASVDGILLAPNGSAAINDRINQATGERDIPVLCMMSDEAGSGRSGYVGINNYEQGQAYGMLLQRLASESEEERLEVSMLRTTSAGREDGEAEADFSGDVVYTGLIEYLNNHELGDRISVSRSSVNQASVFNCKRDIQILLQREDAPNVIICDNYMLTLSACQVLVDRNLVGTVQVLGSYISDEILDYVQKGTLYGTVAVDPYELGRICVSELVELCEEGRTNDYYPLEMMIVDGDNVRTYISRYLEVQNEAE